MKYLSKEALENFDAAEFSKTEPYPWANPSNLLTKKGYDILCNNMPDISLFTKKFGKARKHGQMSHDRYSLKYEEDKDVPQAWHEFVSELQGDTYMNFIRKSFGVKDINLIFSWFYTPAGCSVSPHCDSFDKVGVHLFYFNKDDEWKDEWGGQTVILGSDKKIPRASAPEFEDFPLQISGKTSGTHSLLFKRTNLSWHGVRDITCPEGVLRKVFMVSYRHGNPLTKYYHMLTV